MTQAEEKQPAAEAPKEDPAAKTAVAKALKVKVADVLAARREDKMLFATIADGRKVRIDGKGVTVLTGPGFRDEE
jgi:hypothetical protein